MLQWDILTAAGANPSCGETGVTKMLFDFNGDGKTSLSEWISGNLIIQNAARGPEQRKLSPSCGSDHYQMCVILGIGDNSMEDNDAWYDQYVDSQLKTLYGIFGYSPRMSAAIAYWWISHTYDAQKTERMLKLIVKQMSRYRLTEAGIIDAAERFGRTHQYITV